MAGPIAEVLSEGDKNSEFYEWTVGTHYGINVGEVRALHSRGAGSYDNFYRKTGWCAHVHGSQLLSEILPRLSIGKNCRIIDVGAGTGLVGVELHKLGYSELTGIDLSEEMLAEASDKGVYTELSQLDLYGGDLSPYLARFDAAISIGTFTAGQLKPEILEKVASLVRPGGAVVICIRDITWNNVEARYAQEVEKLGKSGVWTLMEERVLPYHSKLGENAYYIALKLQ